MSSASTPIPPAGDASCLLTELDHQRLSRLAQDHEPLQALLDGAELLPSPRLPADIVSMNSELEVVELGTGRQRRLTLCYPAEARPDEGRISVLSPVGLSLLGRPVGAQASWRTPGGGDGATLLISALLYQPEASGDLLR
ncbi:transcription elongation factor GreAB [Roseateles sp. DAIF2]|uniref:GreA/GreB family elongation factor n=1 Tax=Roseateles sp. DAIF2 TaxID=2714952 RepID=UPI0018A2E0FE|nr:GreA/GreB family elongation factor [Roseateles sp. DAIF2]QPF75936.1 transcription elongation factor GreAB [Roseateles sp. DAIF2]